MTIAPSSRAGAGPGSTPPPSTAPPRRPLPGWRARIEDASRLGVGILAGVVDPDGRRPGVATVVGLGLDAQRRALDLGTTVAHHAGWAARASGIGRATSHLAPPARRVLEPWTTDGREEVARARNAAATTVTGATTTVTERLLDLIDLDAVLARVDVAALLARIDVQAVIDRVDVQGVIERVDVQAIVDRVDVEAIVDRVDLDRIVQRVDVAAIVGRVDVDAIVERTELGSLIVQSTSGVATEALDVVRSQGVGLDAWLARAVDRVLRRRGGGRPVGPPRLVTPALPRAADDTDPT